MTDTSSLAPTHPPAAAPPSQPPAPLASPPAVDGAAAHPSTADDDEPYTIKCICSFADDDGSTVYCERCDTWQHIVCYYEKQEVPEIHNCADCEPRFLDARGAAERQRRLREQSQGGGRGSKRAGGKAARRKTAREREGEGGSSAGTGARERSESTSRVRDGAAPPPAKRAKASHRATTSTTSLATSERKSRTAPAIPYYAPEFLHLYDHDPGVVGRETNTFETIALTKDLMAWAHDPARVPEDGTGRAARAIFTHCARLDAARWPRLTVATKTGAAAEPGGRRPAWKLVTVDAAVRRDEVVGEVRGRVGYLRDYSLAPANRWAELRHPAPFVFFHPQLPVYIDGREEGTPLRYVRRSCQPNVTLKTFIVDQSEYHFCFVANQDIPAHAEITATWYLDPQLFGAHGFFKAEGASEIVPEAAAIAMSNVLSRFGGCACESSTCFLAKIDRRRRIPKAETGAKASARRAKAKSRSTIQTDAARATLEVTKKQQQQSQSQQQQIPPPQPPPHDDASTPSTHTSPTTSARPSRPLSSPPAPSPPPTTTPPSADPFAGELSAREKRKLAAVERKFEQLAQRPKRRRRDRASTADARPRSSSPAAAKPRPEKRARRTSSASGGTASPLGRGKGSPAPGRKTYAHAAVQVDMDAEEAAAAGRAGAARALRGGGFVPPDIVRFRGLLRMYEADRRQFEEMQRRKERGEGTGVNGSALDAGGQPAGAPLTPAPSDEVRRSDAGMATSPVRPPAEASLPSIAAHTTPLLAHPSIPPHQRSSDRALAPLVISPPSATHPTTSPTLASAASSTRLSPSAPNGAAAAPVRKKLTLGDYMSRRGTLSALPTPTVEKTPAQALAVPDVKPLDEEGDTSMGNAAEGRAAVVAPGVNVQGVPRQITGLGGERTERQGGAVGEASASSSGVGEGRTERRE